MSFTVVIPTCGRLDSLARCLRALPAGAEVIVTDDDGGGAVREMVSNSFPGVRYLAGPRRGPAANRNHGAKAAGSEWVAFVDDDCEPQTGWLDALDAATGEADVIEGRTIAPGASDSPFEEHVENQSGGVLWSCNLAVRREVFERLGGFDEDFTEAGGEDMEFAWRVARAGLRVRFAPQALVFHPPRRIGWRGLWRRTWMIRWMALYQLKTGHSTSLPGILARETADLFRVTLHFVVRPERARWRRVAFAIVWRWITFPAVLPWMLFWDWRFRRELSSRLESAAAR
jgi:GT2 family glycosyltransferase